MLRGTVYVVTDDTVLLRWVWHEDVDNPLVFEARVRAWPSLQRMPPDARLEFGPIGEPWGFSKPKG